MSDELELAPQNIEQEFDEDGKLNDFCFSKIFDSKSDSLFFEQKQSLKSRKRQQNVKDVDLMKVINDFEILTHY